MRHRIWRWPVAILVLVGAFPGAAMLTHSAADNGPPGARNPAASDTMSERLAINGYDPVAYFTVGKPVPGLAAITANVQGRTYRFATATNRDAFLRAPATYAPQYDGYCAMGMAEARKEAGDPLLWRIIDGKLYLNVGPEAAKRWRGDIPGHIAAAEKAWQTMHGAKTGAF